MPKELLRIPSKTFLMGEYSVLIGGRSLVLTHSPFFSITDESPTEKFHPESPAGKLLKDKEQNFSFKDPYEGGGGFGGSTAEYLAASKTLNPQVKRGELLRAYFENFQDEKISPSGADLCAQSFLETAVVEYSKEPLEAVCHQWPFKGLKVLVFKTSNKVKTHKHLEDLDLENLNDLAHVSENVVSAFVEGDEVAFLNGVNSFTKEQALLGLLHEETMRLVVLLSKLEGVAATRGCGAMGADVLAVFVKADSKDYILDEILNMKLGLKFIFSN